MAKTVKKKVTKKATPKPLEVITPYPKDEKDKNKEYKDSCKLPPLKSDDNYWGEKMVKLQDRINELELTVNDMHVKLKQVAGRMGM